MTGFWIIALSLSATGGGRLIETVQPRQISVYTYSRDSDQGFKDERLDTFRRELGKYASPLMELGYARETADVTVQFLGQGDLAIELDADGKPVRHLWTPDDEAQRMWAVVRIGRERPFAKEFSVRGSGGRDISRLAKAIGDWLQNNSTVIREP